MQRMLSVQDTLSRLAGALPWGEGTFSSAQLVPFHRSARPEPTAVHADEAVQETLLSSANVPAGLGVAWMAQLLPFHTSARVAKLGPVSELPTASQELVDVHETPASWLLAAPLTLGVDWMDQLLPFHTSASVVLVEPVVAWPTALHALQDVQDTPPDPLSFAPLGLGVDWMDQLLPFHTSASVCVVELGVAWPTASQELADVHEMLLSSPPPGSGTVTTVQVLPLRTSARRVLAFVVPTATQEPVDVQDTAPKSQIDAPCGIAVICGCQLATAGCATISASGTTSAAVIISRFITKRVISYSPGDISPSSARTGTVGWWPRVSIARDLGELLCS
jgi:hypothetical protein